MHEGKILVVDDSEITLNMIRKALEEEGFNVSTVSSIFQFNQAITQDPPEVILLDVHMPVLSGDQLVRILKRYSFSREITVLLHSDMDPGELAEMAAQTGASGFIPKTDPENLIRQLKPWLESARTLGMPSA